MAFLSFIHYPCCGLGLSDEANELCQQDDQEHSNGELHLDVGWMCRFGRLCFLRCVDQSVSDPFSSWFGVCVPSFFVSMCPCECSDVCALLMQDDEAEEEEEEWFDGVESDGIKQKRGLMRGQRTEDRGERGGKDAEPFLGLVCAAQRSLVEQYFCSYPLSRTQLCLTMYVDLITATLSVVCLPQPN